MQLPFQFTSMEVQAPAEPEMISGAIISDCGRYRYQLWRIWDDSKPKVLFLMHNPSTADEKDDDRTVGRCIGFAKQWGYGGIYIGNLYAYRAKKPEALLKLSPAEVNPPEATFHINAMVNKCRLHVLAHGNPIFKAQALTYPENTQWHYLHLTKAGNPGHPLYLKGELIPIKIATKQDVNTYIDTLTI